LYDFRGIWFCGILCMCKSHFFLYSSVLSSMLVICNSWRMELQCPGITSEDVRKSDLLAELTNVMSDGVTQDLWILSIGIDNNPWDLYQPLIPLDAM
jgi:hypothetical protein